MNEKEFNERLLSGNAADLANESLDIKLLDKKLLDMKLLKKETEKIIMEYMPKLGEYNEPVTSAMHYSISAGGKRLRPILIYLTYKAFGGDKDTVLPFMAAIEMIHTYSLIHDDLPALDNDDLRRGRKTCHVVYGEDMAILAGDSLLNLGFETAAKSFLIEPGSVSCERALLLLMQKAGINGMAGGQVRDVFLTGKSISPEELLYIYENKTAALIEASMMTGAILAGASDEDVEKIRNIASNVGLSFQVQDDILDIVSTSETLGKPVGSDEKNEKYTYATIYGLEAARDYVKDKTVEAVGLLDSVFRDGNIYSNTLRELLMSLIDRDR